MSTAEERINQEAKPAETGRSAGQKSILDRGMAQISSVRFGVTLLCIMVVMCVIGMVVMQQNVEGFESYYAGLTPSEKILGEWLLIFDIYHAWYFKVLLLTLSLNIILASIDHFPTALKFITKKKKGSTPIGLTGQPVHAMIEMSAASEAEVIGKVRDAFKHQGLKTSVSEFLGKQNVFGERGTWNRLGAYGVHVFLLTLFLGHFIALQTGFDADVRLMPGMVTNQIQIVEHVVDPEKGVDIERYVAEPPFTITCTDIEQTLSDPNGSIDIRNTIDWSTDLRIDDPVYGTTVAKVSLNHPLSYRGYRFFQASAITQGAARTMKLTLTPEKGGDPFEIDLQRNGSVDLPDGTKIEYQAFFPDFAMVEGKPDTRSGDYNNPAVLLGVTAPGAEVKNAYAFERKLPDGVPVGAPVAGYKYKLTSYQKSPLAHVLSIKYDPYYGHIIAWYIGGFGVIGMLVLIYFFAHRRMWAVIEDAGDGNYKVHLGGNTNRNHFRFEDQFKKITAELSKKV